jgi:predicted alpha/beta hydrolase family esterase
MDKLARLDVYACALPMPSPDEPALHAWVEEIGRAIGAPDESVFLVGHSLGVPAVLHYLATLPAGSRIGGAFLVSGPIRLSDHERYAKIASFFTPPADLVLAQKACAHFTVIHGDNDPVVPFSDGEEFARELSCELISIPNGGHLNGSAGWRELPQLLEQISRVLPA